MIDSSTPYWPTSLPVPLITGKPSVDPKSVSTVMETARIRKRRMFDQQLELVEVEWNFTADQFDTFKTFYEGELENGSLTFVMNLFPDESAGEKEMGFTEDQYGFTRTDNLFTVRATLQMIEEDWPFWNYSACAVTGLTNGGGDNFQCYPVGSISATPGVLFQQGYHILTLQGGTGFLAAWQHGENPFSVLGESFDGYAVSASSVPRSMSQGTGFSAVWKIGENPIFAVGDTFDTYTVGAAGTLNAGTGFSGNWLHGDA